MYAVRLNKKKSYLLPENYHYITKTDLSFRVTPDYSVLHLLAILEVLSKVTFSKKLVYN
jgi:hypothetical protein